MLKRQHGTISAYEMEWLRENKVWRDTRWNHLWAAVSDKRHPRTLEEWREMMNDEKGI